jgi:DNA-binding CsgD family transcriptional regulator
VGAVRERNRQASAGYTVRYVHTQVLFTPRRWAEALRQRPERIGDVEDLLSWLDGPLRAIFPYQRFLGCYGVLNAGRVEVRRRVALGHDSAALERLPLALDFATSGCIRRWAETRRPLLVDFAAPPDFVTKSERLLFRDAGRVAAHGVIDLAANVGTYFAFGGLHGPLGSAHAEALDLMAPTLNAMLVELVSAKEKPLDPLAALTPRQRDVARLATSGATAKAMANHLGLSEQTVRNALTHIYAELGVSGRAALIALLR